MFTATVIVKLTLTAFPYATVISAFVGLVYAWITRGSTEPGQILDTCARIGLLGVLM